MLSGRPRPGWKVPGAVLAALALVGPASAASPPDIHGTYRLQGQVEVNASPFPAREDELHADAVLSAGARAGEVRVRVAGEGVACELTASLGATGVLAFPRDQRCSAVLHAEEAEGRIEARLVSGSGRVREEVLELELAFALSGSVQLRAGGTLDALGKALSLPGAGGQPVPVRGEARGRATGRRDRSRAAQ